MNSMTRPSCEDREGEDRTEGGSRPWKTPRTCRMNGLLPWHIMSTSRSRDELDLRVCVCVWGYGKTNKTIRRTVSNRTSIRFLLFAVNWKSLPVIIMEQFYRHVAAPPTMPGFIDLTKPPGADNMPALQAGVNNQLRSFATEPWHDSLEEGITAGYS